MIHFRLGQNYKSFLCTCIFLCLYVTTNAKCFVAAETALEIVVEYAVWRGWHQAIIQIPENKADCYSPTVRLMKCLSVNGIASAVNVKKKVRIYSFLGIVIVLPTLQGTGIKSFTFTINQINQWKMNTASYDWLIIAKSQQDFKVLSNILNGTAIRFDQNIVLAVPNSARQKNTCFKICDCNVTYKKNNRIWKHYSKLNMSNQSSYAFSNSKGYSFNNVTNNVLNKKYYGTSLRFTGVAKHRQYNNTLGNNLPLLRSGLLNYNFSRNFKVVNISYFSLNKVVRKWSSENYINNTSLNIYLVQCFKVRINSTLYAKYLGAWSQRRSMSLVDMPYPTEARHFVGEKFIVGKCNSSTERSTVLDDDGSSAPVLLSDILHFLTLRLNATSIIKYYSELGFRTYEGAWTGLLGALIDNSVDIALEPVTGIAPRQNDMDFIFPIADTMCNIYIRPQETSAVRDIFLAPFSAKLLACVACMVLVAATALMIISRITSSSKETRRVSCFEAAIWATGIICQQGGTWTPQKPAARILLIVCLFFALVTYNAYAAFITSVLSVRVASVSSLSDVLESNLKIGYIRNGVDQMYLMSTKDVQLNAFYIRGYSEAENLVSSAEEGLVRAASQDYAFFASQRLARSTLRSLSQAHGRCELRELPVHSTRAQLAFPLPSGSPYARPILVSLLQLRSGAVLSRLEAALVPAMPLCTPPSGFASARASDVKTALFVILSGLLAGLLLGICEYTWKNRSKYTLGVKTYFENLFN